MSFQAAQRVASSQFCSTSSSPAYESHTDRTAHCRVRSSAEQPRSDSRQRAHVRKEWVGVGCPLPRGPHRPVSSNNGTGPAVMQGLGSSRPKQRLQDGASPQEQPFDCTEFIAETLLPTLTGKYRLRGYRHTVMSLPSITFLFWCIPCRQESSRTLLPVACAGLCKEFSLSVLFRGLKRADATNTMQFDGGRTYTEPSCIMTGYPEGLENVRILHFLL